MKNLFIKNIFNAAILFTIFSLSCAEYEIEIDSSKLGTNTGTGITANCGNGVCETTEATTTCWQDCGSSCGDTVCNGTETTTSCASDCPFTPTCGDLTCNGTETTASCWQDCGSSCGDTVCNGAETSVTCPTDCQSEGSIASPVNYSYADLPRAGKVDSASYYSITGLTPGQTYSANLTNTNGDTDIYVYSDSSYLVQLCSHFDNIIIDKQCTFTAPASGIIYIKTDSDTGADITYTLNITNPPVCGNSILEGVEECDDGNTSSNDGCSWNCISEIISTTPITIDTPVVDSIVNYANIKDYTFSATAGQNYVIWWNGSWYGDGTQSGQIQVSAIGQTSGTQYFSWVLDGYNYPETIMPAINETIIIRVRTVDIGSYVIEVSDPVCANNIVETGEPCDDGGTVNGDGCDANCQIEICGNNVVQSHIGEQCDDDNTMNNDGCSSECLTEETISATILTDNSIVSGVIDTGYDLREYTFDVVANEYYTIWWNDSANGDVTQTADIQVSVYNDSIGYFMYDSTGTNQLQNEDHAYTNPYEIHPDFTGTVTLKVTARSYYNSNKGTFEISVKHHQCGDGTVDTTENCDDGNLFDSDGCSSLCLFEAITPASLTLGQWQNGRILNSTDSVTYTFASIAAESYHIRWNDDSSGDNSQSGDIKVTATGLTSGMTFFTTINHGWQPASVQIINAVINEDIEILVEPYSTSSNDLGSFQIIAKKPICGDNYLDIDETCDDANTIPGDGCDDVCQIESESIILGAWTDGAITSLNSQKGYSIDGALAGDGYRIWWNDSYSGDGSQNLDIKVSAKDSLLTPLFTDINSGYTSAQEIAITNDGPVTVIVNPYYVTKIGNFQILVEKAECGDGFFDTSTNEQCDDGNLINGDGCSNICEVEPESIIDGVWMNGELTYSIPTRLYRIYGALAGEKYRIWWNDDYKGDGTQTLYDADVTATDDFAGTNFFTNLSNGWDAPKIINTVNNGSISLKVSNYWGYYGTFQIKAEKAICGDIYIDPDLGEECDDLNATSGDGCSDTCQFEPILASLNVLYGDTILNTVPADIYRISVTEGNQYRVWWNDVIDGDGTQTLDIKVTATDLTSSTDFFTDINQGYRHPQVFTATNTGYIDVTVTPLNAGNVGIYEIYFSEVTCGDGWVDAGEACDDGNIVDDLNGCTGTCLANNSCGNGTIEDAVEECDDNNLVNGDGCDNTCQLEPISLDTAYLLTPIYNYQGNMFDVKANNTVNIKNFKQSFNSTGTHTVEIYYIPGGYTGKIANGSAWLYAGSAEVSINNPQVSQPIIIPIDLNLTIPAGETYGFYVTIASGTGTLRSLWGTAEGAIYSADANIEIKEGIGIYYPFNSTLSYKPRVWNGTVVYTTP
ncbi:MAG: DUF4215 domain-containing protein [Spirochaetia bacterium]|nr:DUF4215 domain-containing protein [Spirochaetia bacterium]